MLSTTNSVNVTLVGADADGDPLTYTATLVTGGGLAGASDVTLSVSGNVITVDPVSNFAGTIRVQATVNDGQDSANQTFDVIVTAPNNAPTLAAVSNVNMLSTTNSVNVALVGADADGDTLTYTATLVTGGGLAGASDVTLSVSGNVITVDPVSNFAGTIRVQATVSDGEDSASRTFDVIVTAPNTGPTVTEVLDQTMTYSQDSLTLSIVAIDVDGDSLVYTAQAGAIPAAANPTFTWSGSQLTIDPADGFLGTFNVTVTVDDGADSASTSFSVTVINNAPVLASVPNQTVSANAGSISLPISASDPDGDTLSYWGEAVQVDSAQAEAYALQSAYSFRPAASQYYNSRGLGDKWFYGNGSQWFYVLPDGNVYQWGGTIAASTLVGSVDPVYHSDLSLLMTVSEPVSSPMPGSYTWSGNQMTYDIPDGFAGTFTINIRVSDALESATTSFDVNVENTAPTIGDVATQTMSHSQDSITIPLVINDADGDPLTRTATASQTDPVAQSAYDLDQQYQFRAAASQYYNSRGLGDKWFYGNGSQWFYILPSGAIHRWTGTVASSPLIGTLDSSYHADLASLFNAQPATTPANDVILSWSGDQLTVNPPSGFLGTISVTVDVSDGFNTTSKSFDVEVTSNPPVITSVPDQTISANAGVFTLSINATDADGDPLTYWGEAIQIDSAQAEAYALKSTYGFFAGPTEYYNQRGLNEKYFRGSGSKWFYIVPNGAIYQWGGSISASSLVGTVDSSYHTNLSQLYSVQQPTASPLGGTYTWSGNQMTIDYPDSFVGTFTVNVRVSDGVDTATTSFDVDVQNSAPVIGDVPTQTMSYTQNSITVPLVISDADGDTLTRNATATQADPTAQLAYDLDQQYQFRLAGNGSYNARGAGEKYMFGNGSQWFFILPTGAIHRWTGTIAGSPLIGTLDSSYHADPNNLFNAQPATTPANDVTLSWSGDQLTIDPANGFFGTVSITVNVSDGVTTTTESFDVNVTSSAPVIADIPNQTMAIGQNSIAVAIAASDADGDAISYSAQAMQIDSTQLAAFDLQQAHQFRLAGNGYYNARGQGEKYMFGDGSQWFYILPSGAIHKWAGTIASSPLIGTVDSSYHANPNLLFTVQQPVATPINAGLTWSGNTLTINRPAGLVGSFDVTVEVTAGGETVAKTFTVDLPASLQAAPSTDSPSTDALPAESSDIADSALLATMHLIASDAQAAAGDASSSADMLAVIESQAQSLLASRRDSEQSNAEAIEQLVDELDDILLGLQMHS